MNLVVAVVVAWGVVVEVEGAWLGLFQRERESKIRNNEAQIVITYI